MPSNISPLPNDESNGEDSSKLLNCQDEESASNIATEVSSSENNFENETLQNYIEKEIDHSFGENASGLNCENEVAQNYDETEAIQNYSENQTAQNFSENEIAQNYDDDAQNYTDKDLEINEGTLSLENEFVQPYDNNVVSDRVNEDIINKIYFSDQPDDEYAQELEESLDQITSLDIIDRIEQSLMDQLQKEDPFEVYNTYIFFLMIFCIFVNLLICLYITLSLA